MSSNVVNLKILKNFVSTVLRRNQLAAQAGKTFEGNRDLYKVLGYKRVLDIGDYQDRYDRGDIAARIVDAFPLSTWRNPPIVKAVTNHPTFDKAWDTLQKKHSIFHYLERSDRLSGIGQYGILLMGLSGGGSLDSPAKIPAKLLYLSPFHQGNSPIKFINGDASNERFGLPQSYTVNLGSVSDLSNANRTLNNKEVHWSRVLHIAEGLNEDEVYGSPRMMKVWNRLDDIEKVVGGSSEAVWRTVDRGIQFDVDKDMDLDAADEEAFTEEIEEYIHNVKRYIRTKGITANVLGSETPDPTGVFGVLIAMISGTTGIPQRILLGAEAGQMASSQDERNFVARIKERQENYAGPKILRPFVERLISVGALPVPRGGITFEWPDLSIQSLKEKADVAARMGQAIANVSKHTAQGGIALITPDEFRKIYMGIEEKIDLSAIPKPVQPVKTKEAIIPQKDE